MAFPPGEQDTSEAARAGANILLHRPPSRKADVMFTWDFPYASQRMPLLAKNVVATSQPLAAQAGLQALA